MEPITCDKVPVAALLITHLKSQTMKISLCSLNVKEKVYYFSTVQWLRVTIKSNIKSKEYKREIKKKNVNSILEIQLLWFE